MKQKLFNLFLSIAMAVQVCGFGAVYAQTTETGGIVENGGFEDGMDSWSGNATLFSADTTEKRTGNASLKVSVDETKKSAWNKVTQTVKVTAGKTYALSFYSKFASGRGTQHIGDNRLTLTIPETEWTKHTEVFTAQSDTVTIGFGNYYGQTVEFFVDDIQITEVDAKILPETVLNGDFENPADGLGWNTSGSVIFGISKNERHSGNKSLMLKIAAEQNKVDNYSNYSQTVNVIRGEEYQLAFYYKNVRGKAIVKLTYGKDENGNDKKIERFLNSQSEWNQNIIDFTAESDSVKIEITNNKGNYDAELYFDDFELTRRENLLIGNKSKEFADGALKVSATVEKINYEKTSADIIVAIYDESGKLLNVKIQKADFSAQNTYEVSAGFDVAEGKTYNVFIYAWDSVGNMNPAIPCESF